MKFKSIFILLNITLVLFFVILVFLPLVMLGSSFAATFWKTNWLQVLILGVLFFAFNIFYFTNKRLFLLLEKEDWPALVRYLEERVIQKGRYSPRLVRLLANSYLVLTDSAAVISLENKVALAKPSLIEANVLIFGTARILGKDISGAVRFFETHMDSAKASTKEWVRWYHGFALLLDRQFEKAGEEFTFLARTSKDGIIAGLASFFLRETLATAVMEKEQEYKEVSVLGKGRVLAVMSKLKDWNKEISHLSTEIHVAALAKYLKDASNWLYDGQA